MVEPFVAMCSHFSVCISKWMHHFIKLQQLNFQSVLHFGYYLCFWVSCIYNLCLSGSYFVWLPPFVSQLSIYMRYTCVSLFPFSERGHTDENHICSPSEWINRKSRNWRRTHKHTWLDMQYQCHTCSGVVNMLIEKWKRIMIKITSLLAIMYQ